MAMADDALNFLIWHTTAENVVAPLLEQVWIIPIIALGFMEKLFLGV